MDPILAFSICLAVITALAGGVSVALLRPLLPLLEELCGNAARARFWGVFSVAGTILTTLFSTLRAAPSASARVQQGYEAFDVLVVGSRAGVLGLLASVVLLGLVLIGAIRSYESQHLAGRFRAPSQS